MAADASKAVRSKALPPHPARDLKLELLGDVALLALIQHAIALARGRELDAELVEIIGGELVDMQIEREARRAAHGEPNMLDALPSVIEAKRGAP